MRDLKRDLEICSAATRGPWEVMFNFNVKSQNGRAIANTGGYSTNLENSEKLYNESCNNAIFIAEARTGWPETIQRALAAEEERDKLRVENKQLQNVIDSNTKTYLEAVRENERLREALRPFAEFILWLDAAKENGETDFDDHTAVIRLSVGGGSNALYIADFRFANAAFGGRRLEELHRRGSEIRLEWNSKVEELEAEVKWLKEERDSLGELADRLRDELNNEKQVRKKAETEIERLRETSNQLEDINFNNENKWQEEVVHLKGVVSILLSLVENTDLYITDSEREQAIFTARAVLGGEDND